MNTKWLSRAAVLVLILVAAGLGWRFGFSTGLSTNTVQSSSAVTIPKTLPVEHTGEKTPDTDSSAARTKQSEEEAKYVALKKSTILPCSNAQLNDKTIDLLDLSAEEVQIIQSILDDTLSDIQALEEKHVQRLAEADGEVLYIPSFWNQGGSQAWQKMTNSIGAAIGGVRGEVLNEALTKKGYGFGGFGYYPRTLWVSEDVVADDGRKDDRVHIRNERLSVDETATIPPPPVGADVQKSVFPSNPAFQARYGKLFEIVSSR